MGGVTAGVQIIYEAAAVLGHMSGMAAIVRSSFVNSCGHGSDEGVEQLLDLLHIAHVLNGDGCLRGYGLCQQNHILDEAAYIALFVQSVDQLQDAQPLPLSVAHGNHQHGLGAVFRQGVVVHGAGEVVLVAAPHILHQNVSVVQQGQSAYVLPAQWNRRQLGHCPVPADIGLQGIVSHDSEPQDIIVQQVQRACVTVGKLHGA